MVASGPSSPTKICSSTFSPRVGFGPPIRRAKEVKDFISLDNGGDTSVVSWCRKQIVRCWRAAFSLASQTNVAKPRAQMECRIDGFHTQKPKCSSLKTSLGPTHAAKPELLKQSRP